MPSRLDASPAPSPASEASRGIPPVPPSNPQTAPLSGPYRSGIHLGHRPTLVPLAYRHSCSAICPRSGAPHGSSAAPTAVRPYSEHAELMDCIYIGECGFAFANVEDSRSGVASPVETGPVRFMLDEIRSVSAARASPGRRARASPVYGTRREDSWTKTSTSRTGERILVGAGL